jgi:hypothetical protein
MTLFVNQLLDQQETTDGQAKEVEKEETNEDTTQESAMFQWD